MGYRQRRVFLTPFDTGTFDFSKKYFKIVSKKKPRKNQRVMKALKITFYGSEIKKNGKRRYFQQTTTGYSKAMHKDDEDALFNSAFRNCVAQISFSFHRYDIIDEVYVWFVNKDKTENWTDDYEQKQLNRYVNEYGGYDEE